MAKISKIIFVLALVVLTTFNIAKAQEEIWKGSIGATGSTLSAKLTSDSVFTIQGSGDMENYQELTVPWKAHKDKIKTIIMPVGLNRIGSHAFNGCENLSTPLIIPDGVTRINDYAFDRCSKLTKVTIGDAGEDLIILGQRTFGNCTALTTVICKGSQPPQLNKVYMMHSFEELPTTAKLIVPCGAILDYEGSEWNNKFSSITEDCGNSIYDVSLNEINLYPNPTTNSFVINCENNSTIKLYDVTGKEVLMQNNANGKTEINISQLPKGIYSIKVFSDDKVVGINRVVKQ